MIPARPNGHWTGTPGVAGVAIPIPTEPHTTTIVELNPVGEFIYLCVRESGVVVGDEDDNTDSVVLYSTNSAGGRAFALQGNPQREKFLWVWGPVDEYVSINFYGG